MRRIWWAAGVACALLWPNASAWCRQVVPGRPHDLGTHDVGAMSAMLWSLVVLIAAPAVLVAVGAWWHVRTQRLQDSDPAA